MKSVIKKILCLGALLCCGTIPTAARGAPLRDECQPSPNIRELNSTMIMRQSYVPIFGQWYAGEEESRWIGKTASVLLRSGFSSQAALIIESYIPPEQLSAIGPVTIRLLINGQYFDSPVFDTANKYYYKALLPKALSARATLCVTLSTDKIFSPPGDPRELGLLLQRISVEETNDGIISSLRE